MVEDIATIVTSLGFPSVEAFIGAMFLVLAVVAVIVVVSTIKPVLDMFPYTYPNARVRARTGRLFTEKEFSEIVESQNIEEVKNYLRSVPDYAKYIDQYPLEKALDTQLAETYDLIARITPDNSKEVFQFLLKKWDIRNIKSIIIAKEAGLSSEETLNLIVPFGALTDKLDSLIEADNVTEVLNALEGTEYPKILEDAIPIYNETGLLLPLEASLDKYLLKNLLRASATPEDDNTSLLHNYIGTMVDVANIKIIIRAKADDLKFEDIEAYMISDGYQIREWKLKELMEAEDVAGVVNGLEGTDYAPMLSDAMSDYTETNSMASFENALDSHLTKTAKTISLKNQFGIGPMIGFLNRKESEVKKLKIIARGKREAGFSTSMIKEMLI
ncbi:V-type ATP synthase subunit C [Methanobacterium sp. SMA-27]|uniref:V-type ATP synthase subunit C n=1 Tax=Methanobacterium sp. SMA-27 TaxID=1495336 RepID=UPI00064EBCB5|nr:V-type ATP synthase subunit C [Methanobacterium sp. SMA-27]